MAKQTPPEPSEPLAYSIPDAARVSGLSRSLLYELMAEGELDYSKVRRRRIIPHRGLKGLQALIERHRRSAA
jgi:hypothetical protein